MSNNKISINNRRHNRNLSTEEKRNYCLAWKRSEMRQDIFCKTHGISKSALYQWSKEYKKENKAMGFSPLILSDPTSTKPVDIIHLSICLPNQMQLNIEMPEHRLAAFIQEVSNATTAIR